MEKKQINTKMLNKKMKLAAPLIFLALALVLLLSCASGNEKHSPYEQYKSNVQLVGVGEGIGGMLSIEMFKAKIDSSEYLIVRSRDGGVDVTKIK